MRSGGLPSNVDEGTATKSSDAISNNGIARSFHSGHASLLPPRPEPRRPGNTYVREDQILPALGCDRHTARRPCRREPRPAQVTGPADTAALIEQLHANGVVLTYDYPLRPEAERG